jgi:hypothetical protein
MGGDGATAPGLDRDVDELTSRRYSG